MYSNLGFLTLGYALVGASKTPYPSLLSEITIPLYMQSTTANLSGFPAELIATGHYNGNERMICGAADLKSSPTDMWRWMMANLTASDQTSPLSQALRNATKLQLGSINQCTNSNKYGPDMGYAWEIANDGMVWKDGATGRGGCSAWIGMMPSQDPNQRLGVAIMVNGYNSDPKAGTSVVPDPYGRAILNDIYKMITS
jgi:CubicO group peptidase (beta-lactamase class C family)